MRELILFSMMLNLYHTAGCIKWNYTKRNTLKDSKKAQKMHTLYQKILFVEFLLLMHHLNLQFYSESSVQRRKRLRPNLATWESHRWLTPTRNYPLEKAYLHIIISKKEVLYNIFTAYVRRTMYMYWKMNIK